MLVCDGGTRIPVLPSDALAVAVREGLPITMAEEILDEVGQPVAELFPDGGAAPPEEQVQEMRDVPRRRGRRTTSPTRRRP